MKNIKKYIFLLLVGVLSLPISAQDVEAVTQATEWLRKAMLDADEMALKNLTTKELTYGHSSGRVEDQVEYIKNTAEEITNYNTLEFGDVDVMVKGDVAWVRHTFVSDLIHEGNPAQVNLKVLLVWVKENGLWKLFSRQAVR